MAKPELRDHRKFLKLKRLLGEPTPHVIGYLECLWSRGYQTGNPKLGDELDIEAAAEWPGESGKFAAAAIEAGFVDRDESGSYEIHDLYHHAPKYVQKRMVRKGFGPKEALPSVPRDWSKRTNVDPGGVQTDQCGPQHGSKRPNVDPIAKNQEPRAKNQEKKTTLPAAGDEGEQSISSDPDPSVKQKPAKVRERNPLVDAIAEVTGLSPATDGGLLGKVAANLAKLDPPFAPDEVYAFARRFWELCTWAARDKRERPTANEIERYGPMIRAGPLNRNPKDHPATIGPPPTLPPSPAEREKIRKSLREGGWQPSIPGPDT